MLNQLTIGRLAREAGVNVETIRYYQRRRLLPRPQKPASGYRQYSYDVLRRIRFIRTAQKLGFSLKEIQELLNLKVAPGITCADVEKRTAKKIQDVDRRVQELKAIRNVLISLKKLCKGNVPSSECPILEALEVG